MSPSEMVLLPSSETKALVVSNTNCAPAVEAVASPVLHTLAATGNVSGPPAGALLSRPRTFHVNGVTVSRAAAWAGAAGSATRASAATAATRTSDRWGPRHNR